MSGRLLCLLACAACGRIAIDPISAVDGGADAGSADEPMVTDAAPAVPPASSLLVPAGTFLRSYDVAGDGVFTDTSHPATVSDFRLDMYEVTVARFRQFLAAGGGTQQRPPASGAGARTLNGLADQGGWDPAWNSNLPVDTAAAMALAKCGTFYSWTDTPGANENLPISCITWYQAFAFCAWDGGFLPTEAEWSYAAGGGDEQRALPWSSPGSSVAGDCGNANFVNAGTYCVSPPKGAVNRVGSESPRGDGRWGHADLGGNVWEWLLDSYEAAYPSPCNDCADLTPTVNRTIRGGAFNQPTRPMRPAARNYQTPTFHGYDAGVRCARKP